MVTNKQEGEQPRISHIFPPPVECTKLITLCLHSFLEKCGGKLVCLRLSCCQYVDNEVIKSLCQCCPNLEGLYSFKFRALPHWTFSEFSSWCQECCSLTNQSEGVTFPTNHNLNQNHTWFSSGVFFPRLVAGFSAHIYRLRFLELDLPFCANFSYMYPLTTLPVTNI